MNPIPVTPSNKPYTKLTYVKKYDLRVIPMLDKTIHSQIQTTLMTLKKWDVRTGLVAYDENDRLLTLPSPTPRPLYKYRVIYSPREIPEEPELLERYVKFDRQRVDFQGFQLKIVLAHNQPFGCIFENIHDILRVEGIFFNETERMVKFTGVINATETVAKKVEYPVKEKNLVRSVKFTDPITPCTNDNFRQHIMEMSGIEESSSARSEQNTTNPHLKRQGLFSDNDCDSKSPKLNDVAITSESNIMNQAVGHRGCEINNCGSMASEQVHDDGTLNKGGYESSMFNMDQNYNFTMESNFLTNPELSNGSQGSKHNGEIVNLNLAKANTDDDQNNKKVASAPSSDVQLPLEPVCSGSMDNDLGDGDLYVKKSDLDRFES